MTQDLNSTDLRIASTALSYISENLTPDLWQAVSETVLIIAKGQARNVSTRVKAIAACAHALDFADDLPEKILPSIIDELSNISDKSTELVKSRLAVRNHRII
jgi:hypothetical protein